MCLHFETTNANNNLHMVKHYLDSIETKTSYCFVKLGKFIRLEVYINLSNTPSPSVTSLETNSYA